MIPRIIGWNAGSGMASRNGLQKKDLFRRFPVKMFFIGYRLSFRFVYHSISVIRRGVEGVELQRLFR